MSNLSAIRAAVETAKGLAAEFHTASMNLFREGDDGEPVIVFEAIPVRLKKPKPSSFDAGNQTEWATKRILIAKAPMDISPYGPGNTTTAETIIPLGLIAQVTTPDGDPTINGINFTVQSALTSQFAAEREITLTTEIRPTPRIEP